MIYISLLGHISKWDVSKVTNMRSMFSNCISFNQNINYWDVLNVTNMKYIFHNFDQLLNKWDISNVKNLFSCWRIDDEPVFIGGFVKFK